VPTQIKASFLKLRVVHVLDPMAASTGPMLIDKELVVILDQELGGIARVLLGIPQSAPRKHEVACEDRGPTLADETLANDYRPDAVTMEIERGVAPGRPSADDDNICGLDLHYSNNRGNFGSGALVLAKVLRSLFGEHDRGQVCIRARDSRH